jgi:hypothetical protein
VKKTVLLALLFVVVVIAMLVYTTLGVSRYRCEVCITFQGRRACRTASASRKEQALRAAVENACALIAAGVTETTQCEGTPPDSVKWLSANQKAGTMGN